MASRFGVQNTTAPFHRAVAVTPSDATVLDQTDALMIGTAGNVAVKMADGNVVTIAVPVGVLHVACTQVRATNTTAAGITALYRQIP